MNSTILTPKMLKIGADILDWSRFYIAKENNNINRPKGSQAICPFVKPSIDNNSYFLAFHPEVDDNSIEEIQKIPLSYIDSFKKLTPTGKKSVYQKALLVVFNNMSDQNAFKLDQIHANIKDRFVTNGLMIGQFHPNCDERGVYNSKFKVSVSPYAFFAIRSIAIHDILFLKEKKTWFHTFDQIYGANFKQKKLEDCNGHLEEFYLEASERYGHLKNEA